MNAIGFTAAEFDRIEWISDRGANIKKALEGLGGGREDCAAHQINTVVRSTFTVPFYELRSTAIAGSDEVGRLLSA